MSKFTPDSRRVRWISWLRATAAMAVIMLGLGCGDSRSGETAQRNESTETSVPSVADEPKRPEPIVKFLEECLTSGAAATVARYQAAADKDDARAQFVVGYALLHGLQVQANQALGLKWIRLSAARGEVESQLQLGLCLAGGVGCEPCPLEAGRWLRSAAEAGHTEAQAALIVHLHDGSAEIEGEVWAEGTNAGTAVSDCRQFRRQLLEYVMPGRQSGELHDDRMVFWCIREANSGNAKAQCLLANHLQGRKPVMPEALAKSTVWSRKAAEQGDPCAQLELAVALLEGRGVMRDSSEAMAWLRKAGDAGNIGAMLRLANEYLEGRVVEADPELAYFWLNRAAARGNDDARKKLDELATKLNPAQIRRAESIRSDGNSGPSLVYPEQEIDLRATPKMMGTGFFISEHGLVLTCAHVVADCRTVRVSVDGRLLEAAVSRVDASIDIAAIKVTGKFEPLKLGDTRQVELGADVYTVGFPNPELQGSSPKFGQGTIAALNGARDDVKYFQVSIPIQPGNSGGPLLDSRGAVIGIIASKLDARAAVATSGAIPEGVAYSLKGSYINAFLDGIPGVETASTFWRGSRSATDIANSAKRSCVMVLAYD